MTPKKHNEVAGTVELQLTKEPEEIAWLTGHHVEFMPMYMKYVQLTKQLEEIIDLFQDDHRDKVLEIMRAHDSLPDLFMVCLEYVCRDPSFEASINAQVRHAPTKSVILDMKTLYLERLAERPTLTKSGFAHTENKKLTAVHDAEKKQIAFFEAQLDELKKQLAQVEKGDISTRRTTRQEIRAVKTSLADLKKALVKPYTTRQIARWLEGVEPFPETLTS